MSAEQLLKDQRVLLTGAAGKLGRRLRGPLSALCRELVMTDLVPVTCLRENERYVYCDMSDADSVSRLTAGVDSIVHFAGYPREADWATLIPANIVATTNLWEAALSKNVKKIIYASTNHVVGFHPTTRRIGVRADIKCDSRYGVSKAFTEILAQFYYDKYALESLGLRIGRCEDAPTDGRMMSTWIHPDDLAQLVKLGLTRSVGASVLYGISSNLRAWCFNPSDPAFPYLPQHTADDFEVDIPKEGPSHELIFQGGPFADAGYVGDRQRASQLPQLDNYS
jgi:uronate dehydrogenase